MNLKLHLLAVFVCIGAVRGITLKQLERNVKTLREKVVGLSNHLIMQQFYFEERVRTEGSSGIKTVKGFDNGFFNFEATSYTDTGAFSMNERLEHRRTLGMGPVTAVLNGADFRTRAIDHRLDMPSLTSKDFLAVEPIPLPEVPSSVTGSVDAQIAEMQEWFKAFQNQDKSQRDYTQYFKPVLCYLEGFWSAEEELRDGFHSEIHQLDASSWADMQDKVRFATHIGVEEKDDNLAALPTTVWSVDDATGKATYAYWNYRVVCSPVSRDIPFSSFQQVDELGNRLANNITKAEAKNKRTARFKLWEDRAEDQLFNVLDEIFEKIPGLDNIPGELNQVTVDPKDKFLDPTITSSETPLNTGYYHRWYKYDKVDGDGLYIHARCFNDDSCWVAENTRPEIAPKHYKNTINRFSYAIPLEIAFLSPLLSWNPYNLKINQDQATTTAGGRDGSNDSNKAFDGVDERNWYLTPASFFTKLPEQVGRKDSGKSAYVLDPKGNVQHVAGSGPRILVPNVKGISEPVRLRWPIAPVHAEGSAVSRELNALKFHRL